MTAHIQHGTRKLCTLTTVKSDRITARRACLLTRVDTPNSVLRLRTANTINTYQARDGGGGCSTCRRDASNRAGGRAGFGPIASLTSPTTWSEPPPASATSARRYVVLRRRQTARSAPADQLPREGSFSTPVNRSVSVRARVGTSTRNS